MYCLKHNNRMKRGCCLTASPFAAKSKKCRRMGSDFLLSSKRLSKDFQFYFYTAFNGSRPQAYEKASDRTTASTIKYFIGRAAAHAAIFPLVNPRKEPLPVCRHVKWKKVSMRWLRSIALRSSADFIRQYTSLAKTCATVYASIEQEKTSACSGRENRPVLTKTQSTDISMQKG